MGSALSTPWYISCPRLHLKYSDLALQDLELLHRLKRKTTDPDSTRRLHHLIRTMPQQETLPPAAWPHITMVTDWANLLAPTCVWEQHEELPDDWITATTIADHATKIGPGTLWKTCDLLRISSQHQLALQRRHFFPTSVNRDKLPGLVNGLVHTICSYLVDAKRKRRDHSCPSALTFPCLHTPLSPLPPSPIAATKRVHFAPDSADKGCSSLVNFCPDARPMVHPALTPCSIVLDSTAEFFTVAAKGSTDLILVG